MADEQGNYQDQDWSPPMKEDQARARGRAFPLWIWGCGGGCLMVLVIVFGAMFWLGNKMYEQIGPEAAWPVIAEVMPYGPERPDGYMPMLIDVGNLQGFMTMFPGVSEEDVADIDVPVDQQLIINRIDGTELDQSFSATLYIFPVGTDAAERRDITRQQANVLGAGSDEVGEPVDVTLTFKGREVTATRFQGNPAMQNALAEVDGVMQILEIDLSEGRAKPIVLHLAGRTEPTEDDLNVFFEPFDVWGGK